MNAALLLLLTESPTDSHVEQVVLRLLVQIVVIMAAARVFGFLFRWVGQPQVCGEIAAGLILGPSLFGGLFPRLFESVFHPSAGSIMSALSQIGLVLLLFLIGLEFEFKHLRDHSHQAAGISIAGMVLPFGFGLGVAQIIYPHVGQGINRLGFTLFIATALSITALPVLGRMLLEFNLNRTRLGSITISAAAVDDACGWIALALVTAIVRSNFSVLASVEMVGEVVAYALFMIFVARPLLIRWSRRALREGNGDLTLTSLAVLLIMVFISASITNVIGIFSVFGGFIMGAVLHDQPELAEAIRRRLRDFVTVFFLPIFFTYTGLRTDIGTMQGGLLWGLCGLVLLAAMIGKLGGCAAAAKLSGFSKRESCIIGVLMNTRGLMELVAINIGYELGVIPKSVFFILVFMAVVTTFMTTPIVTRLIAKTEMSAHFHASEYMKQGQTLAVAIARLRGNGRVSQEAGRV